MVTLIRRNAVQNLKSYESYDDILSGLNLSYYKDCYKEIPIERIPWCIEEYLDVLKRYYWSDKVVKEIYGCIKEKRSASEYMPHYCEGNYERWFIDLMDKCYHLEYKQNVIAEAMEIYRTQYFAENHPVEFLKYKLNKMKKS